MSKHDIPQIMGKPADEGATLVSTPDSVKPTRTSAAPKLVSIRFREGVTLDRLNAVQHVDLTSKAFERYEVAVVGASVFIRAPGQRLVEVPRVACVLSYAADGSFEDALRAVNGGKR